MKSKLFAVLVAIAITVATSAAFAGVTQTCFDNGSIRVPAKAMQGLNQQGVILAACDENQWGQGDMTGYEMTKDPAGDYVISKDKVADGRLHPVQIVNGKVIFAKTHAVKGLTVDRSEGGTNLKAEAACK